MELACKVWRVLVGVKDALVLAAMLLFFALVYAVLTQRPMAHRAEKGALLLNMRGTIVEELQSPDPLQVLAGGGRPASELRERDVLRAISGAATDPAIKAVVLDLSGFAGGGHVHITEIGAAMDKVRAAKKPVLVFGNMLEDSGVQLAAHASEVWIDPLGGAFVTGPGGTHLYYGKLLDRLKITAHVYRVGTFKDYVEPFIRNDMSAPSRDARKALYEAIFAQWRADVTKARPKAQIDRVMGDPAGWLRASGGDAARASLAAGLVDRIGTRAEFGAHVATIAGDDKSGSDAAKRPGAFAHISLGQWIAGHPESKEGRPIGVITVAGDITDGTAGPGSAGGERIARLIDDADAKKLAALVVRVDSPGGSVGGAEAIRAAILRQKAKGVPVVVSMANLAASGGYWVSTPATRIFAQPETITGSIGIFAVIPSFEKTLAEYGVSGDGVRTSPLSGQPDPVTGLTPEVEAMLQANIEAGYGRFVGLVAASRHKTAEQVDAIAQGRVWDGETARRIGLVDQFGGLDDALVAAATAGHLKAGEWHPVFLRSEPSGLGRLLAQFHQGDDAAGGDDSGAGDDGRAGDWVGLVAERQRAGLGQVVTDVARLMGAHGAQAYCLECAAVSGGSAPAPGRADMALAGAAAARGGAWGWGLRMMAMLGLGG